jgi:hypothetical protein
MDLADLVQSSAVEEHALRRGSLAGIDMCRKTHISVFFYWILSSHFIFLPPKVSKSLVRICGLMLILSHLNRAAGVIAGIQQFSG